MTLSSADRHTLALSATLEPNRLAGQHWLYYAADVLQHWSEDGDVQEAAQGLRAAGDHCLAAMLIDVSGRDVGLQRKSRRAALRFSTTIINSSNATGRYRWKRNGLLLWTITRKCGIS